MKTIDHIRIIWAIARKDITNSLKNLVLLSVALGVIVLVGSSQIGVLLQELSGYYIVYIYDTSSHNLAYSPRIPSTLRLSTVASDEELNRRLVYSPGPALGIKITDDNLQSLIVDAFYAHWTDQNEANNIAAITKQFLQLELAVEVSVQLSDDPVYPKSMTNPMVNSMSIMLIIALFAFCGSLVTTLIVEEKRRKTLDVLMVSPASVIDIIGGKAVAGMFYGVLTSCVTVLLFNPYIIHWGIAVIVSLAGSMLAVVIGLFLGIFLNSYRSMNIYSAGMMFLLFLPLVFELLGMNATESFELLLQLFPIPALMDLTRMMYINSIQSDLLLLSIGVLILWIAGIGFSATWLVTRINS